MKIHVEGAEVEHHWEWGVRDDDGTVRPRTHDSAWVSALFGGKVVRRLVVTTEWQEVGE